MVSLYKMSIGILECRRVPAGRYDRFVMSGLGLDVCRLSKIATQMPNPSITAVSVPRKAAVNGDLRKFHFLADMSISPLLRDRGRYLEILVPEIKWLVSSTKASIELLSEASDMSSFSGAISAIERHEKPSQAVLNVVSITYKWWTLGVIGCGSHGIFLLPTLVRICAIRTREGGPLSSKQRPVREDSDPMWFDSVELGCSRKWRGL